MARTLFELGICLACLGVVGVSIAWWRALRRMNSPELRSARIVLVALALICGGVALEVGLRYNRLVGS
jgi:hypothetical protein